MFSPFSKKYASTRSVFESFSLVNTKTQKEWRGTTVAFLTGGAPYDLGLHRIPKAPFFVRPHENDMPAFLKNSKIRKRCLRVDGRLHGGAKKALFSKISLFVWKGPYVASEKIFPPPNGKTVGFCFYNPKKWSLVRKSFAKGFIWMETLSRDIGFLLNSEQSLPNGSYTHCNEDFISACSIYALFDFSLEKCMYDICRN